MSNLFDILSLRQDRPIEERSGHAQDKNSSATIDEGRIKSTGFDVNETHGVRDRKRRRSSPSENVDLGVEDEASQGDQDEQHVGEDKIYELESFKQYTIPKKEKAKKGN